MFQHSENCRKKRQEGFTLVEIAIVMVIIGLLIGGVLKGQQMIKSAKVKRVAKMADEIRAAVNTFYDKYGMLPGDENSTTIPTGDTGNGDGLGTITTGERFMVFEDLMNAKLISGNYDGVGDLPKHAFGGNVFGIYWVNPPGAPGTDHFIRFDTLPWDVCLEIDTKYDDGVFNTGSIVGNAAYTQANGVIGQFFMPL